MMRAWMLIYKVEYFYITQFNMATVVPHCPCGLTREAVMTAKTFNSQGICQVIVDDLGNKCGRRANQHPLAVRQTTTQGMSFLSSCSHLTLQLIHLHSIPSSA